MPNVKLGFSVVAGCMAALAGSLSAQVTTWQPSPGHVQIPLWPRAVPDAKPAAGPEVATTRLHDHFVAGRPWTYIQNVSVPTVTVYRPTGANTGVAAATAFSNPICV